MLVSNKQSFHKTIENNKAENNGRWINVTDEFVTKKFNIPIN